MVECFLVNFVEEVVKESVIFVGRDEVGACFTGGGEEVFGVNIGFAFGCGETDITGESVKSFAEAEELEGLFGCIILFFCFDVGFIGDWFFKGVPKGVGGRLHPKFQVRSQWFLVGFIRIGGGKGEDDFSFDLLDGVIETDTGFNPKVLEVSFSFPEGLVIFGE